MKSIRLLVLLAILSIATFVFSWILMVDLLQHDFVRGPYSIHCYERGEEHGNIKTKLYFKTIEECEKDIISK